MSPHAAISEHEFKRAMRQVASSVAVVTSCRGTVRNGLTITAACSVSPDPPTMLVCINRNAPVNSLISESGHFAINFLTEEQHNVARLFSKTNLRSDEQFAEGCWLTMMSEAPILEGAAAGFDCEVEDRLIVGTHHVYFGRVLAVVSADSDLLLYRDGLLRRLASLE